MGLCSRRIILVSMKWRRKEPCGMAEPQSSEIGKFIVSLRPCQKINTVESDWEWYPVLTFGILIHICVHVPPDTCAPIQTCTHIILWPYKEMHASLGSFMLFSILQYLSSSALFIIGCTSSFLNFRYIMSIVIMWFIIKNYIRIIFFIQLPCV